MEPGTTQPEAAAPIAENGKTDLVPSSDCCSETLDHNRQFYGDAFSELNIREIYMDSPYVIVQLTNGNLGVAFNFDHEDQPFRLDDEGKGKYIWAAIGAELLTRSRTDHLLMKTLLTNPNPKKFYELSLQVAILNALSQTQNSDSKYLRRGRLTVEKGPIPLPYLTRKGDVLGVIGFGGYFHHGLYDSNIPMILVSDSFLPRSSEMRKVAAEFLENFPGKVRFFTGASDSEGIVLESDIACITASALCNGTMDRLLRAARDGKCREVIVHGHTGGLLSAPLFERGATIHIPSSVKRDFLSKAIQYTAMMREGRIAASNLRTVHQEDNFYDFIDVNLKSVTVRERSLRPARIRRIVKRKIANGFRRFQQPNPRSATRAPFSRLNTPSQP